MTTSTCVYYIYLVLFNIIYHKYKNIIKKKKGNLSLFFSKFSFFFFTPLLYDLEPLQFPHDPLCL